MWVAGGIVLLVVAASLLAAAVAKYGSRPTLPHAGVALVIAAAALELLGAVALSRVVALGRVHQALLMPLFFAWPVLLALAVLVIVTPGGNPAFLLPGPPRR